MTLEAQLTALAEAQRETNRLLTTLLAHAEGDRETLDKIKREQEASKALQPGTILYGFCGGYFGRESYEDKTVTDVRWNGRDLVVTALEDDRYEVTAEFTSFEHAAECLVEYLTDPETREAERAAERRATLDQVAVLRDLGAVRVVPVREPEKPIEERVAEGWAGL
jgi:hypothetical protein